MSNPIVSVIICTRNRSDNVLPAAQSVLRGDYTDLELLIMDQSDDNSTADAVMSLCEEDSRVRYFHLAPSGKPGALNAALQEARGRYLALTDDDCESATQWIRALIAPFEKDAKVGAVFGDVRAAPHDQTQGYIPDNPVEYDRSIASLRDYLRMPNMVNFGIGANMAVRADVLHEVNGWDPCIGPGSRFRNGDDHDITVRILLAGYTVAFTRAARIVHFGYRLWSESAKDVANAGYGFGTSFAKFLRCGTLYYGSLRILFHFLGQIVWRSLRFQRPLGIAFPRGWLRGAMEAANYPMDRTTRCFLKTDATAYGEDGHRYSQVVLRTNQAEQVEMPASASSLPPNAKQGEGPPSR